MDISQLLETCLVTGGMGNVLYYLNNKVETDTDIALLGYMSCSFLLILLHQIAPLFYSNPVQKTEGIYRSSSSQGLWCVFLIPAICTLANYSNRTDNIATLDIDLLCILLTLTLTLVHYNPTNVSQIAGALLLIWLKDSFKTQDKYSLGACTLASIVYYLSLSKLPQLFPRSFTYGEVTIVLQSTFVLVYKATLFVTWGTPRNGEPYPFLEFSMIKISFLALLGVGLSTVLLYLLRRWSSKWKFYIVYCLSVVFCVGFGLPKKNPAVVLIRYIIADLQRMYLFIWCSFLTAIMFVYMSCHDNKSYVSTSARKFFHVIIVAVYIPGLWLNSTFLLIASMLAFCVMVVVETVRNMDVAPFGRQLKEKYQLFLDKQDQGPLVLTPLYLIYGLSMPLWLSFISDIPGSHISVYAGMLSVGIGDAVASVVGSSFGKLKWPGSKKTLEGTLASFVAQVISLCCLEYFCGVQSAMTVYTLASVAVTTMLEAVMAQIDNLVLPLFLYSLLMMDVL